jgi:hypothetical protein
MGTGVSLIWTMNEADDTEFLRMFKTPLAFDIMYPIFRPRKVVVLKNARYLNIPVLKSSEL